MSDTDFVLTISCPDAPGIVASVSSLIYTYQGNIVDADHHTDSSVGLFLQRIRVTKIVSVQAFIQDFTQLAEKYSMQWKIHTYEDKQSMLLLVSQQLHCAADLLSRIYLQELSVNVVGLISDHSQAKSLAEMYSIPFYYLPVLEDNRESQEKALADCIENIQPDFLVLARYMKILEPKLCDAWQGKIINIHHSFLPAFIGSKPYHRAHERGVKLIGATAHYVTKDLDAGPIIAQDVATVSHREEVSDLIRKGKDIERMVLAEAVRLHLEQRVLIYGNRTVVFD